MINLITQKLQKIIQREYRLRLIIVVMVGVSILVLLGIILLLPSYFIVLERENAVEESAHTITAQEKFQENQQLADDIQKTNEQLKVLSRVSEEKLSEPLLRVILSLRANEAPTVTLGQIVYNNEENNFTLRGGAPNRTDLIVFTQALQQHESFEQVDVPVSNLAQNRDISFQMTLHINDNEE